MTWQAWISLGVAIIGWALVAVLIRRHQFELDGYKSQARYAAHMLEYQDRLINIYLKRMGPPPLTAAERAAFTHVQPSEFGIEEMVEERDS